MTLFRIFPYVDKNDEVTIKRKKSIGFKKR